MTETGSPRVPRLAFLLLFILSFIWGSSFVLMKLGLEAFSPMQIATLRMAITGLCLFPFALPYLKQYSWKKIGFLAVNGLIGNGIPALLFPAAEEKLPTAVAGVLNALTPIWTILIAAVIFGVHINPKKIIGIGIGLAGTVMLAMLGQEEISMGENIRYSLLILLATVMYGTSVNLTKQYFQDTPVMAISGVPFAVMAVPSLLFLLVFDQGDAGFLQIMDHHPKAWSSLGYIAILAAIGTAIAVVMFYKMLKISNIIFATSITYTIPVVAVCLGVFLLGEPLQVLHYVGFAVVLVGVYLANRKW